MVVVVQIVRDLGLLLSALLQVVKLLSFDSGLALKVIKFPSLDRKVLLNVPLTLSTICGFLRGQGLLLYLVL